ncbi:MAG: hypothetical protein ACOYYS_12635 [Chloroflexota bacterium]
MASEKMRIDVKELQAITNILYDHLESLEIRHVDISDDYYWNINGKKIYDPYQSPTNLDMGQLTDNWQELQKLLKGEREPIAYEFVWLAALLRAIGEKVAR